MVERVGDGTEGRGGQITLAEEIRRGSGLQAVSRLFQSLVKNPDRILIPNPDPAKRGTTITVHALIIPRTFLRRLPEGIYTVPMSRGQTVTGTLAALFIPDSTQALEYRLYPKLLPTTGQGGGVLYTPSHVLLKAHQVLYDGQEPAVQQLLLIATVQAIYLRVREEQKQQAAAITPPWSKIFNP